MTIKIRPELLHQWREQAPRDTGLAANFIADKAAEWAADQPKPLSLKEQAAKELLHLRMEMKRRDLDVPATPALARAIESIADAERMRWLLDGNGYFMEEEGLCGVHPCSEDEMNRAREIINEQMLKTGHVHCTAHVDYKPSGDT